MTQQQMQLLVPQKLRQIEQDHGIRVLYAAESGSRAWGTSSAKSDFDVRFIYLRPKDDYLRLDPLRDVLEFPINDSWDLCGWDLTKVLQLLHNANSQIYEWLASPVVYVDDGFSARFRPVLETCFSVRTTVHHYLHQSDLKGKKRSKTDTPKVKHYLYSLQHTAAARWVLEHHTPVPVSFPALMPLFPERIREAAYALWLQKTSRPDQPFTVCDPEVEAWLLQEREQIRLELDQLPVEPENDWDLLNRFFLAELAHQDICPRE